MNLPTYICHTPTDVPIYVANSHDHRTIVIPLISKSHSSMFDYFPMDPNTSWEDTEPHKSYPRYSQTVSKKVFGSAGLIAIRYCQISSNSTINWLDSHNIALTWHIISIYIYTIVSSIIIIVITICFSSICFLLLNSHSSIIYENEAISVFFSA